MTKYPLTVLELILINEAIGKSGQQNRNKTINFKERNGIFAFIRSMPILDCILGACVGDYANI